MAEAGSIREVAASLIVPPDGPTSTREQTRPEDDDRPITPDGSEAEEHDGDDELRADEGDDSHELAPETDSGEEAGDDDPTYRVKVDGETREVSLSELIQSYSGEGAIAKRLKDATEARNAALQARDAAIELERGAAREVIQRETETLRTQAQQLAAVYQTYASAILQPEVEMPDPNLRASDPLGWLTMMEAYRQDQDRLRAQAAHMQEVVQEANRLQTAQAVEHARSQVQMMVAEVPAMGNPEYRRAQAQRVLEIGKAVGFSEQEVRSGATDRRIIYLAMLAAKGAEDMIRVRTGGKPKVETKAAPPKPQAVSRARDGRFKAGKANVEAAKRTGSVEDVAKTMIVRGPGKPAPFRSRVL